MHAGTGPGGLSHHHVARLVHVPSLVPGAGTTQANVNSHTVAQIEAVRQRCIAALALVPARWRRRRESAFLAVLFPSASFSSSPLLCLCAWRWLCLTAFAITPVQLLSTASTASKLGREETLLDPRIHGQGKRASDRQTRGNSSCAYRMFNPCWPRARRYRYILRTAHAVRTCRQAVRRA